LLEVQIGGAGNLHTEQREDDREKLQRIGT
jgi:hypothetical protein